MVAWGLGRFRSIDLNRYISIYIELSRFVFFLFFINYGHARAKVGNFLGGTGLDLECAAVPVAGRFCCLPCGIGAHVADVVDAYVDVFLAKGGNHY